MHCSKAISGALLVGALVASGTAQAQYVRATEIGFESFECDDNPAPIPDGDFGVGLPDPNPNLLPLDGSEFFGCGIESITSVSGGLNGTPHLYRPDELNLLDAIFVGDAISGVDGTALIGNTGTGIGSIVITFRTPVNELSFTVLDLDNGGTVTFRTRDNDGNETNRDFAATGGSFTFDETLPQGVKSVKLDYGGIAANWAVENLRFNTWSCGDGEPETAAANAENPNPEGCDDGDGVQCDGCRTDCTVDVVGCLVDGSCVENGSIDPASEGCASCNQGATDQPEVVGYNAVAAADTDCSALGDDGLSCTTNVCNGEGACTHPVIEGNCAIAGECFTDGDGNPDSQCQLCDGDVSDNGWTPRAMGSPCDDGDACTDATPDDDDPTNGDVCNDQGACVAGATLSCDDGLGCTVDTCESDTGCVFTLATGCLISDGTGQRVCHAARESNPDNPCEECQPETDRREWSPSASGERCGDPSCEAGVLTPAPTCDGSGTCTDNPEQSCEGAVCVDPVSCTGTCQDDDGCLEENFCRDGECVDDQPSGEPCDRNAQCESGFCVDGVCCDAACDRDCEACDTAGSVGMCTPHPASSDPEGDCPTEPEVQVCNGSSQCVDADLPNGTPCTQGGECESGVCVDGVCCDQPCDGECEACNQENRVGMCTPYPLQTDPEMECEQACNGAGQCVAYEVRGNGFCATSPGRTASGWAACLLALLATGLWRRRTAKGRG